MSWQPISTAPSGETLLVNVGGMVLVATNQDDIGMWTAYVPGVPLLFQPEVRPTHWQPLPAPPES